jgi:hypothetical protein
MFINTVLKQIGMFSKKGFYSKANKYFEEKKITRDMYSNLTFIILSHEKLWTVTSRKLCRNCVAKL